MTRSAVLMRNYILGDFEDSDLCMRARAHGCSIALAEQVYVIPPGTAIAKSGINQSLENRADLLQLLVSHTTVGCQHT